MQRDADGDQFFGFCGARVYVPDDDPRAEGIAEGVLRRFRERLAAELSVRGNRQRARLPRPQVGNARKGTSKEGS